MLKEEAGGRMKAKDGERPFPRWQKGENERGAHRSLISFPIGFRVRSEVVSVFLWFGRKRGEDRSAGRARRRAERAVRSYEVFCVCPSTTSPSNRSRFLEKRSAERE